MRGRSNVWACTPCALLLLSAVVPRQAVALFQGSGVRDTVHKVFKVKVTEEMHSLWSDDPRMMAMRKKERRDGGSVCPTSYALCAASLGGNCCPDNYACSKDYCYATTAATSTSTCGGQAGYYACAQSLGGGCCPQGLVCATDDACSSPAGATYSMTCPTGYFQCAASLGGGCCTNGMGCAVSSCYSTSPSTSTITYTTTQDGSAVVVTTTSVTTPATPTGDSTVAGAVPKYFASTVSKALATSTSSSSSSGGSGGGGLSKAEIGGIIAGVLILLIAVLTAAYLIIKRLKRTERVVQSVRETTSGTRTRRTHMNGDKKSEVSQVRVRPTPSEVDQMDYDPLMMTNHNSNLGSPRRPLVVSNNLNGRARGDSDAESQDRSLWSGPSAGMRWNTPSVDSDPGSDPAGNGHGVKEYFELPPRTHDNDNNNSNSNRPQMPMRSSVDSSSQFSYHNYPYGRGHGRHWSNASELSAGSEETAGGGGGGGGGNGGVGSSPLMLPGSSMPTPPQELGVEGEFRPELPGSDTETESNYGGGTRPPPRPPRRRSTNGVVSPMSIHTATMMNHSNSNNGGGGNNRPPGTTIASRRRGNSLISPVEEEQTGGRVGADEQQLQQQRRALGSIDESASTNTGKDSLHGHFGRPFADPVNEVPHGVDMAGAPMGLGLSLMGGMDEADQQDGTQEKSK